jgi:diguanylate cyclase (GGDEF)-like protein
MLQVTIVMLVLDTFGRLDGNPDTVYSQLNYFGNFFVFLLSPVAPSLWLLYAHCEVYHDESRTKRLMKPLFAISALNAVLTVLSLHFKWFYYIDDENIYHRGPLFLVPAFLTVGLILAAFILILLNRKSVEKKHYYSLILFAVPPFISVIIQIIFYGMSFMLNAVTISLLIIFITIQNRRMDTDYLTGVYNRKRLESYMKYRISASSENNTFSAILIDLDNFKNINDTLGHDAGDQALEVSVSLLKSCLRSNDFIARYGGDEFYIILDVSNKDDLERTIERINHCLEKYNENPAKAYPLGFSMGYAVYDVDSHLKAEEFQKQIDIMMYENKRNRT